MNPVNLLGLDLDGLTAFCEQLGEKRFRATQLFRWIHQKGAADFDQMSDLAKSLREKLRDKAHITALPVISEHLSTDGTIKWLFDVGAGNAVEAVFIPEYGDAGPPQVGVPPPRGAAASGRGRTVLDRGTLCISSQAGCAVGCRFCSTGHQGFSRNLETAEIIAQLWFAEHSLRKRFNAHRPPGRPKGDSSPAGGGAGTPATGGATQERLITNVVMMGMGEPLQNYNALVPALRMMLDDHGYGLSRRRVTVSTSGVVPMIDRLREDVPVALAVSLHAPTDALRDQLVPLNKKYPIAELLESCKRYLDKAPRDFITFEYCMLDGVNDSPEQAEALVKLLREHPQAPGRPKAAGAASGGSSPTGERGGGSGVACKLNLIPFNPFPASGLKRSSHVRVQAFAEVLIKAGIVTTVRKTRGDDIDAACGQLAGEVQDRTRVETRMVRAPVHVQGLKGAAKHS